VKKGLIYLHFKTNKPMNKLQSLNESQFQKFENDQISNQASLSGGAPVNTYARDTHAVNDCLDTGTSDGHTTPDGNGGTSKCDYNKGEGCI
jgi:hypothetical protein